MEHTGIIWISVVIVLIAVFSGLIIRFLSQRKKRREQERAQEEEERREEQKNIKEALQGKKMHVVIRQKGDGKLTWYETEVIRSLISYGAQVIQLDIKSANQLFKGNLEDKERKEPVILGTFWKFTTNTGISFYDLYNLDYRIIGKEGQIISAGYLQSLEKQFIDDIIREIADGFSTPQ